MAYFDNATTTYPKPEIVYQSMDQFQRQTGGNFGRGDYKSSGSVKCLVDDTRSAIQRLLHCPAKQVVLNRQLQSPLTLSFKALFEKGQEMST